MYKRIITLMLLISSLSYASDLINSDARGLELVRAAASHNLQEVKRLLQSRTVDVQGPYGEQALMAAALLSNSGISPAIVRELIKAGANVNAVDNAGVPVIAYAIVGGNIGAVKALINAGADPMATYQGGGTKMDPLDLAKKLYGYSHPITELLLGGFKKS